VVTIEMRGVKLSIKRAWKRLVAVSRSGSSVHAEICGPDLR